MELSIFALLRIINKSADITGFPSPFAIKDWGSQGTSVRGKEKEVAFSVSLGVKKSVWSPRSEQK
ncbi:hypothetical protein ACJJIF_11810 [Microbulbifer sp. SSSA002]|uniref:hypothetical protein n=1 Tax=unclassified Microbulbifer TaxID=2619833 RepID=UPI0040390FAD